MQQNQGTFIVVEGVDSVERSAQFKLLKERLQVEGYDIADFAFPQYDQPSSFFIREYLDDATDPNQVGPYTSALFYALDHYQAAPKIRQALAEDKVVIVDSYISLVMAQQGSNFNNIKDQYGYFTWLNNLEFQMLKNPIPTTSLVLRMPTVQAKQAEAAIYNNLDQIIPGRYTVVDYLQDGAVLPSDAIQVKLWQSIQPLLPAKKTISAANYSKNDYYIPEQFNDDVKQQYCIVIDQIFDLHSEVVSRLNTHIEQVSNRPVNKRDAAGQKLNQIKARNAAQSLLPVATHKIELSGNDSTASGIDALVQKYLPSQYSQETPVAQLTSVWPANEISLVADMLYKQSSLSLNEITDKVADWSYGRKLKIFETYLGNSIDQNNPPGQAFTKAHYGWDLICDYTTFRDLQNCQIVADIERQALTPRYGYATPQLVEDAGLIDEFEQCFELSLKLHSYLQQAGYEQESQYATLQGHKLRCKCSYTARQAFDLYQLAKNPDASGLGYIIEQMHERLAEVHPLLADAITKTKA